MCRVDIVHEAFITLKLLKKVEFLTHFRKSNRLVAYK